MHRKPASSQAGFLLRAVGGASLGEGPLSLHVKLLPAVHVRMHRCQKQRRHSLKEWRLCIFAAFPPSGEATESTALLTGSVEDPVQCALLRCGRRHHAGRSRRYGRHAATPPLSTTLRPACTIVACIHGIEGLALFGRKSRTQLAGCRCHAVHLLGMLTHLGRMELQTLVRRHGLHLLEAGITVFRRHHGTILLHALTGMHIGHPVGFLCGSDLERFSFMLHALGKQGLALFCCQRRMAWTSATSFHHGATAHARTPGRYRSAGGSSSRRGSRCLSLTAESQRGAHGSKGKCEFHLHGKVSLKSDVICFGRFR